MSSPTDLSFLGFPIRLDEQMPRYTLDLVNPNGQRIRVTLESVNASDANGSEREMAGSGWRSLTREEALKVIRLIYRQGNHKRRVDALLTQGLCVRTSGPVTFSTPSTDTKGSEPC